ncbi:MAG: hypothetical protein NVSMB4_07400 [Acidimicrobiales bacterium]
MNLRRRLSIVAALGALIAVIGLITALSAESDRKHALVLVMGAVSLAGLAVVALAVQAQRRTATPLEQVATRARRRSRRPAIPDRPAVPHPPALPDRQADVEVRIVAGALDDAIDDLEAREDELARARDSFRQALSRLGAVLEATHDENGILEAIVEVALLVIPGQTAIYFRAGGVPGRIHATHSGGLGFSQKSITGSPQKRVTGLQLDGTGLAGTAALRLQLAILGPDPVAPDAVSVPIGGLDPAEPAALAGIAAPLFGGGRLVGVLAVYGTTAGRPFRLDEVGLLVSLLRQAEVAINNVEVHLQVRREALTDGVTGLWNRRQFDIRMREAVAASQRFGEPFGVAVFDLDDFKRINDTWDHLTGDAALVHFAAVLRSTTRDVDISCRWGGEEFAVLFQRSAPDDVVMVVQRLIDTLRATPLKKGDETIPFTVSAGVAGYPRDGLTAQEVFAAADAALLRAKAAGKDRLERASLDLDSGHPSPAVIPPGPPPSVIHRSLPR